jgi:zinc/manganese transport system permease protein
LTARPTVGLVLSVLIGVGATWLGEAAAYFSPYPVGFWVTTFGFAAFLLASAWRAVRR